MLIKTKPILNIVVPCYNEEEVIDATSRQLINKLDDLKNKAKIAQLSCLVFVDDGSTDSTWKKIKGLNKRNKYVIGLQLSRNKGQQSALLAGLFEFKDQCDCVITMDADLQDDINAVEEFIDKYTQGFEVIYGVRKSREKDSFFKKNSALFYYRLMQRLGVNIKYNHAHYRLLSNRVVNALTEFKEVNSFLRGIIPLIGFDSADIYYERKARLAGSTKYSFMELLKLGWDGITSFSVIPLKMVSTFGFVISSFTIFAMIYAFTSKLLGYAISGWSSLLISIWFLGGVQLIAIGVVGEYIGKIYQETKQRPKYFIKEKINFM